MFEMFYLTTISSSKKTDIYNRTLDKLKHIYVVIRCEKAFLKQQCYNVGKLFQSQTLNYNKVCFRTATICLISLNVVWDSAV